MAEFLLYGDIDRLPADPRIIEHIRRQNANKFEWYDDVNLICFDWLDITDVSRATEKITICQRKSQVYYICETPELLARLKEYAGQPSRPDKELFRFFTSLLHRDIDAMEDMEERVTDMEDVLLGDNRTDYTVGIIALRKELLRLKRYYEGLSQVFDGILENENGFIAEEDIRFFKLLDQRVDRLLAHIVNLRDYITQVREAYQAQIDIEQNRLMKVFTVVTAIFLPLTLIAGWYGMNLQMPEFGWPYGYVFVIALCALVVGGMIFFFKRKKWF